jgi:NAD(P)-dependent dehydrogenase (short-subunit alcohol dehydrogenase family)
MNDVWLVTGCSRGLGQEIARKVLDAGHRLVATARAPATLQPLVDGYGDHVRAVALDVTDGTAARRAVAVAVREFGGLDVLVDDAGRADPGSVEDTPDESFRRQLDVTSGGVVRMTRAALPVMRARGLVVQTTSRRSARSCGGCASRTGRSRSEPAPPPRGAQPMRDASRTTTAVISSQVSAAAP